MGELPSLNPQLITILKQQFFWKEMMILVEKILQKNVFTIKSLEFFFF